MAFHHQDRQKNVGKGHLGIGEAHDRLLGGAAA